MRFKKKGSLKISFVQKDRKPLFIISANRVSQGGTLEVVHDFLLHADRFFTDKFQFIAYVSQKELYPEVNNIELRELRKTKSGFLYRIWMEYIGFYFISKKLQPDIWFSLQDSTPNVVARHKYLYWGTALLSRGIKWSDLKNDKKLFFISLLYRFLYCRNMHTNDAVFVQQKDNKRFLSEHLNIRPEQIIVSPLNLNYPFAERKKESKNAPFVFIYPCFPYAYKNIELIVEALSFIRRSNIEIQLTCSGNENKYIRRLYKASEHLTAIKWIGFKSRSEIYQVCQKADALIYVSTCESWGIPISMFKKMHKPMIVADLPFAKETVGDYNQVKFISSNDPVQMSECIKAISGNACLFEPAKKNTYDSAVIESWPQMFEFILHENNTGHIRRLQLRPTIAESV